MSAHGWLTPETIPTDDFVCRLLKIPNDIMLIANVNGALTSLCEVWNYEQFGAATVEQTVTAMQAMYDIYRQGTVCLIGSVILYATGSAPSNTLLCDGSTHLKDDYPQLYNVLAPAYIVDATHFIVPNPVSYTGLNYYIVYR